MGLYGFSGELARPLVQIARERLTRPHISTTTTLPHASLPALKAYMLQPVTTIPGATKALNGTLTLGRGDCYLLVRDKNVDPETDDLKYQLDGDGARITKTAYNMCPVDVGPGGDDIGSDSVNDTTTVCMAVTDSFGDLIIVERCVYGIGTSEGSSSNGGSGDVCIVAMGGIAWDDIPIAADADDIQYVLGITNGGCLQRVPLSVCNEGSGS